MRLLHRLARVADRGSRHPFYVVAPTYDPTSAGNRVLYALCEQLHGLGYDSFIVIHEQFAPVRGTLPAGREVAYLTPEIARAHFAARRTPITIYPEITRQMSSAGIRVLYLLNYLGVLGGPAIAPDRDFTLAYSRNVAMRSGGADQVLFIPVSDPTYWTPGTPRPRTRDAVYAGKFVDACGGRIPDELSFATVITRHLPDSPSRDEIRDIFRAARCLHVFENTALATEALLCGCPVVCHPNASFPELIGEQEHGSAGFAQDSDPVSLAAAQAGIPAFRRAYHAAARAVPREVARFARRAQRAARARLYHDPFTVRELRSA